MSGERRDNQGVVTFATMFFQEYKKTIGQDECQPNREVQLWQKPHQDMIKINFDGNVNKAEKKGGMRVLARNDK